MSEFLAYNHFIRACNLTFTLAEITYPNEKKKGSFFLLLEIEFEHQKFTITHSDCPTELTL